MRRANIVGGIGSRSRLRPEEVLLRLIRSSGHYPVLLPTPSSLGSGSGVGASP